MNRNDKRWAAATVGLMALLAVGNVPVLSGKMAPQFDAVDFFGPNFALVGDQLRHGKFLKWDPWIGGGNPDWVEPELGTTSPLLLVASIASLTPQEGYVVYWMAVWVAGGVGMLLLARHLGSPVSGGLIAGAGFMLSGFYTGHAEHMSSLYSVSFLPWIVWRLDLSLVGRQSWPAVQAGALYGLSALGGYPAFTIATPGFLMLWTIGRVCWHGDYRLKITGQKSASGFPILSLGIVLVLGGLIFGLPYFGMLTSTRGFSDRIGPRSREEATTSNLLPAGALSTFASPYLANLNFPPKPVWPETDVSMTSVYVGGVTLVLALFGWRRHAGWRWWLVLLGVFFVAWSLGRQLPLRGWLYDYLPPTRYFRNPALFRAYVVFVIAILAALGARDLLRPDVSDADRLRFWLISAFVGLGSVISFFVVQRLAGKSGDELGAAAVHLVVVWFGVAAIAYMMKERWFRSEVILGFLTTLAILDGVGTLFLSRPTLYTAATIPWWSVMNSRHRSALDVPAFQRDLHNEQGLGTYPNNRNLLLKTATFNSYMTLWNRFHMLTEGDTQLNREAIGNPRLWFASDVAWRFPDDASFTHFRERVYELGGTPVMVLHSPDQMLALLPSDAQQPQRAESNERLSIPSCVPAAVTEAVYQPDSLSFRYDAPSAGYLLVTDRWAPGWEVNVNGLSQPVLGANFIYRAIKVGVGSNLVQFRYNPRGFWLMLFLSWGSLCIVALLQVRRWWQRLNTTDDGLDLPQEAR